ncbi:ABC TRANSPORTER ATP-BINDING [Mycoplasmopsis pulmonis]|uniref:ABC TRANSPORTER ATP-BINDING n=1 Tax=Mycoplasmopsis pulmonis (strain UAB CTIP) TaxID=272635 RepID=Q98RG8_MYCPU|nr:ABC transporter ATP-binding protein [Mycoplasmopsis pulmonis]MDZ7293735.1 ABC transporter ATP-binding protein/permease [Mycoplasmopsis pulmonis]CAC13214.1 ABC TRANSPORTER ATP-BINDING [Mycoplasmopsis pulmonis]VEU67834.1 ABC transporter ATP-binding protein [Mycoplasmopsis pulmonis]
MAFLVYKEIITIGSFIFFVGSIPTFSNFIPNLFSNISEYKSTQPALDEMNLNLKEDKNPVFNENIKEIQLQNLKIQFDKNQVFDNFNYTFSLGKKYAIVGPSGSGKSTLLKILLGLNLNYEGSVKINNKEIKDVNDDFLRNKITYLSNDFFLFKDSIVNNIAMDQQNQKEKLDHSLTLTNLKDELANKDLNDQNFDIENSLSLGQKQRVNLARMFFHNKDFILLDEALANLDKNNIDVILNNLLNDKTKTLIYVSHHLNDEQKNKFDEVLDLKKIHLKN